MAPLGALFDNLAKFAAGDPDKTLAADPGRHPLEQPVDQLVEVRLDLLIVQVGGHQPHAAVDVETDAARRDDPGLGIHGRHAADGKTVAPMPVRHAVGVFDDAGQGGDVGHLVEDPFVHLGEQVFRGNNPGRNPHAFLVGHGKFPDRVGNLYYPGRNNHRLTSLRYGPRRGFAGQEGHGGATSTGDANHDGRGIQAGGRGGATGGIEVRPQEEEGRGTVPAGKNYTILPGRSDNAP